MEIFVCLSAAGGHSSFGSSDHLSPEVLAMLAQMQAGAVPQMTSFLPAAGAASNATTEVARRSNRSGAASRKRQLGDFVADDVDAVALVTEDEDAEKKEREAKKQRRGLGRGRKRDVDDDYEMDESDEESEDEVGRGTRSKKGKATTTATKEPAPSSTPATSAAQGTSTTPTETAGTGNWTKPHMKAFLDEYNKDEWQAKLKSTKRKKVNVFQDIAAAVRTSDPRCFFGC